MEKNPPVRRRRTRIESKSTDLSQKSENKIQNQNILKSNSTAEIKNEIEKESAFLEGENRPSPRNRRRRTHGENENLQQKKMNFPKTEFFSINQIKSFIVPCKELLEIYNFLENLQNNDNQQNDFDNFGDPRRRNIEKQRTYSHFITDNSEKMKYSITNLQKIIKENENNKGKSVFQFIIDYDEIQLLDDLGSLDNGDFNGLNEFYKTYPIAFLSIAKTITFQRIPSEGILEVLSSFSYEIQMSFFDLMLTDIQKLMMIFEYSYDKSSVSIVSDDLKDFVFQNIRIEKSILNDKGEILFMTHVIQSPSEFHTALNGNTPTILQTSNINIGCFDPSSPKYCFLYPISSTSLLCFLSDNSFPKSTLIHATTFVELCYCSQINHEKEEGIKRVAAPTPPPPELSSKNTFFRRKNHHTASVPKFDITPRDIAKTHNDQTDEDSSLYLPPEKVTIRSKSYYENQIQDSPVKIKPELPHKNEEEEEHNEIEDDVPIENYLSYIFMRTKSYSWRGKRIHFQMYLDDRPIFHSKLLNDHPDVIFFNQGTDCHISGLHFGRILVNPNAGTFTLRFPDDPDVDRCVIRYYQPNASGTKRVITLIFLPNSPPKIPVKMKSVKAIMSASGEWEYPNYHKHSINSIKNGALANLETNKMYMSISKISKKEAEVIAHPNIPPEYVFLFAISSYVAKFNNS